MTSRRPPAPPFAEERREQIASIVRDRGRVRVSELVARTGVTEATIRKDLTDLERRRVLRRTHGGALSTAPITEPTLDDRVDRESDAKDAIGRACCTQIRTGDAVFLDTGTTIARIAHHLAQPDVNVLTNSLDVAGILANRPTIRHTVLGGRLRALGGSLVGPITIDTLARFTVNTAFISASGITDDGITVADLDEAHVKRAVIDGARRVVLAIDHTKIGTADFVTVCSLDAIDTIITDRPSTELTIWCSAHDITLICATSP